jgi:hypothetical protein
MTDPYIHLPIVHKGMSTFFLGSLINQVYEIDPLYELAKVLMEAGYNEEDLLCDKIRQVCSDVPLLKIRNHMRDLQIGIPHQR